MKFLVKAFFENVNVFVIIEFVICALMRFFSTLFTVHYKQSTLKVITATIIRP